MFPGRRGEICAEAARRKSGLMVHLEMLRWKRRETVNEDEVAIGREAVLPRIARLVGPGLDISVEWDMQAARRRCLAISRPLAAASRCCSPEVHDWKFLFVTGLDLLMRNHPRVG